MDASFLHQGLARRARVALLLGMMAFLIVGCGRGNDVADDPSANDPGLEELGDDSPPERSFEDDNVPFDRDTPSTTDLDPNELPAAVQDVFFGYDKFELDAEARAVLEENARALRGSDLNILVEGHCDERGTAQYNMALGWKRANEVKRYLVSLGLDAGNIETVSYGKERPFVAGSGEAVWAQNRRAHFRLQDEGQ